MAISQSYKPWHINCTNCVLILMCTTYMVCMYKNRVKNNKFFNKFPLFYPVKGGHPVSGKIQNNAYDM